MKTLMSFLAHQYYDKAAWAWWTWHRDWMRGVQESATYACGAGLAHRLDIDTSGCLLRAKTSSAWDDLRNQFRIHAVKKVYYALGHGLMKVGTELKIAQRLTFSQEHGYTYVDVHKGELAETHIRCEAVFKLKDVYTHGDQYFSLFRITIITGRTHQIRVHLLHINYPLVADKKYNPLS